MEPEHRQKKNRIPNGECSNADSMSSIVDNNPERPGKKKTLSMRSLTHSKIYPSTNSQLSSVSSKSSVLPFVVGHKCFESDNTNNALSNNSTTKPVWSRGSLNLHFARQSRNLRAFKHEELRKNRVSLITFVLIICDIRVWHSEANITFRSQSERCARPLEEWAFLWELCQMC